MMKIINDDALHKNVMFSVLLVWDMLLSIFVPNNLALILCQFQLFEFLYKNSIRRIIMMLVVYFALQFSVFLIFLSSFKFSGI